MLQKITKYLSQNQIPLELSQDVELTQEELQRSQDDLRQALETGALFKRGETESFNVREFMDFLVSQIPRRLKEHQVKAALHLLAVRNGANFSVPGSGKTTVVLAVFDWLRSRSEVDSLFVVGPPSCFAPWCMEYEAVIGKRPSVAILAGGDVDDRQSKYYASKDDLCDLYLTSFQTLLRDWGRVKLLFNQRDVSFAFVVDEAHYIKQLNGAWAKAVLAVAQYAKIRWILTGTPFPQSYVDAFNYFDVLWPRCSPISQHDRIRITNDIQKKKDVDAAHLLNTCIGPLFYRVRKSDLGLAPQDFRPPMMIQMNKHERHVYDSIVEKIRNLSIGDDFQEFELLVRLRRGRMMRLRQCLSYTRLLGTAISEYSEDLLDRQLSLANTIKHYDELESPAKLEATLVLAEQLRQQEEKVVIWSNFVETLKLLRRRLEDAGHRTELIYGETPTETASEKQELTREKIITDFVSRSSGLNVLVANPAACAESISLHKECSHAIYYDLSYNCAQYLQSLDRIHRVGGSENKIAHYYILQYADTIDEDILKNLLRKSENMSAIVDQNYPIYSLDMFSEEEEMAAYERLFR
ncbi:MAG TPA: DEAD/DEAH box helicase [Anaerolineales bacterium]|nr:DEAD/DEAH box helicase [Anaerolineales bacterium]